MEPDYGDFEIATMDDSREVFLNHHIRGEDDEVLDVKEICSWDLEITVLLLSDILSEIRKYIAKRTQ